MFSLLLLTATMLPNYDGTMNLGFPEMMFIFLMALIIFGPRKLPEIGRQVGKALAEFKRYSNDFKYQLETEVRQWEIEETLRKEKESLQHSLKEVVTPVEGTVPTATADATAAATPSSDEVYPTADSKAAYPEPQSEDLNSIYPPKGSDA